MIPAVILIGGFGTRLRPFTLWRPKPLLPVVNRPFLEHQIQFLRSQGIRDIILCTAYKPQDFHRAFGSGKRLGVRMRYVHENKPLGTGGAIKNAERFVTGTTLICNGDILMNLNVKDFLKYHRKNKAAATIALTEVDNPSAYGLVSHDKDFKIDKFIEKPKPNQIICNTINAGFYLFEPAVFSLIPKQTVCSVEREIFPRLLADHRAIFAFLSKGYWLDVGRLQTYRQVNFDLLENKLPVPLSGRIVKPFIRVGKRTKLSRHAHVEGPILIGDDVHIAERVQLVGPTIIGHGVHIGPDTIIKSSILMDSITVGSSVSVTDAVVGSNTIIQSHVHLPPGIALGDKSIITEFSHVS